uniref:Uncharacterized protein n=1 Tax=Arundo donax TaxID=35708 RepID=A0A0A9BL99_ARUDO
MCADTFYFYKKHSRDSICSCTDDDYIQDEK